MLVSFLFLLFVTVAVRVILAAQVEISGVNEPGRQAGCRVSLVKKNRKNPESC